MAIDKMKLAYLYTRYLEQTLNKLLFNLCQFLNFNLIIFYVISLS